LLATTVRGQPVIDGEFVQLELTLARAGASAKRSLLLHFLELGRPREPRSRAQRGELARVLRELASASGEDVILVGPVVELGDAASWTNGDVGVLTGPVGTGLAWLGDGRNGRLDRVVVDAETQWVDQGTPMIVETSDRTLPSPPELVAAARPLLARLCFSESAATATATTPNPPAGQQREIVIDGHVGKIVIID
jgi:hypothetical protein